MRFRLAFLLASLACSVGYALEEIDFETAINRALLHSRQVQVALIDFKLAQNNNLKNVAMMSPQASIAWSDTYYNSAIAFPMNGAQVVIRPDQQAMGSLILTQPLSPIIGLIQKIRADQKAVRAAGYGAELAQCEVAFSTAQAFRQIQQLQDLTQIASDRVGLAQKNADNAQAIFRAGRIGKEDLLRIQMVLGQVQVAHKSIEAQLSGALYQFADLLGFEPDVSLKLPSITKQIDFEENQFQEQPILERLDIKVAKYQLEATRENGWLSVASILPNLSGFARVDKNFTNPGSFGVSEFYSMGLTLSWTFWDGGARFVDMSSAYSLSRKAKLNYITSQRNALYDQQQKRLDFEAARASLALQKTTLEQAEESFKGSVERFKNGALSTTDFLQAEIENNNAKVNWAKAVTDLDIKYMALQKANGHTRPTSLL